MIKICLNGLNVTCNLSVYNLNVLKHNVMSVTGWQWDPKDRPMFKEILLSLDNMFDKTSVTEGNVSKNFHL